MFQKDLICKKCNGKNCILPFEDEEEGFTTCIFCGASYYLNAEKQEPPVIRRRKKRKKKECIE